MNAPSKEKLRDYTHPESGQKVWLRPSDVRVLNRAYATNGTSFRYKRAPKTTKA